MSRVLLLACILLYGCGTNAGNKKQKPTRKGAKAGRAAAKKQGQEAPAGRGERPAARPVPPSRPDAPKFLDGLQTPYRGKFAEDKRWRDRAARYAAHRKAAVETLASRLGLVHDDRKKRIYVRFADQQPGKPRPLSWGRLEWLIVEGLRRPLITLHPESVMARQVTLREAIVFEMTRAALLQRMGAEYYQLPLWLRLGAAYYAAALGETLTDRLLARIAPSAAAPASLMPSFGDKPGSEASEGLLGYLTLSYLESNHGVAALKSFMDQVAVRRVRPRQALQAAIKRPWEEFADEVASFGKRLLVERSRGLLPVYRQALKHYVAGRDTRAIGDLNELLARHQHTYLSGNVRYRLGRAYYRRNAYEEAHTQFSRIWLDNARHCPFVGRAYYWAARCRLRQKRRQEALALLDQLRLLFPRSDKLPAGLMLAGQLAAQSKSLPQARERYLLLLRHFPEREEVPRATLALGEIALQRQAYSRASQWAERLMADAKAPRELRERAKELLARAEQAAGRPLSPTLEKEVRALASRLISRQRAEADRARQRLAEIGPVCAPALGRLLPSAPDALRHPLIDLLAEMANPRAAPYLVRRLPGAGRTERRRLLKALIRIGVPVDLLPDMLESANLPPRVTTEVRGLLSDLTFQTTPALREKLPELIRQLNHPSPAARMKGVNGLNRLQEPDGLPALVALVTSDTDPRIRRESLEGLAVWGDQRAARAYLVALSDSQAGIRQLALQLVARYKLRKALPRVRVLMSDKQVGVRSMAYLTAAAMGDDKLIPRLVEGLRDPATEVRQMTMDSLLRRNRTAVVRAVLPLAEKTTDPRLRGRVFRYLGRLTGINLGYYPEASAAERERMLDRVRQWLRSRAR